MLKAPRHVLIVGGGLAGPCLALSLARHSISSTILEIRHSRSTSGGSISLAPNAIQVLDLYAGVFDQVKAAGYSYHRIQAYTDDGEKVGELSVGDENDEKGYPAVRIMRTTLNSVLLDAGEASGLVDVKYGVELDEIEEDNQGVTVLFKDGTKARGDLLIGADGIHSKVRKHVLGPRNPSPIFTNLCIVNGFVARSSAITTAPGFAFPALMASADGFFMTFPIDPEGETLAWGINKAVEEKPRDEWRRLEQSGEMARLAKDDYKDCKVEPTRSLLDNADDTQAKLWAPFSLPDLPSWHTPKTCLIGDAAHALPPNGQGVGMAFEDAAIMTRLLTSSDFASYDEIFARFEVIRRPRIEKLRETGAKMSGRLRAKASPWVWYLKKLAFKAFFWWNNGLVNFGKKEEFDVNNVILKE